MLLPLLDQFKDETPIEHVFVVEDSYEELLATADPDEWEDPELDENRGCGHVLHERHDRACRRASSTRTARPSSTRSASPRARRSAIQLSEADTFLPVVPMFHANAWGYPYLATMIGANIVYPGPHLDGESLLDAFEQEQVTWTAGVPTIWLGILAQLDANPGKWDLSAAQGHALRRLGAAAGDDRRVQDSGTTSRSSTAGA